LATAVLLVSFNYFHIINKFIAIIKKVDIKLKRGVSRIQGVRVASRIQGVRVVSGIQGVRVFVATFNGISVISRHSVLLVEETVVPGGNHRPVASH
jgi:hypothetical protein